MKKNLYIAREIPNIRSIIKFCLTVFILTMFMTTAHAEKKFKFENYKTAEEAKTELLKRHPIGSDVEPLLETLRGAGAKMDKIQKMTPELKKIYHKTPDNTHTMTGYSYYQKSWVPGVGGTWGGGILIDENNKIIDFGVGIIGEGF